MATACQDGAAVAGFLRPRDQAKPNKLHVRESGDDIPKQRKAGSHMPDQTNPCLTLSTSMGDITLELFAAEAPETVANFNYAHASTITTMSYSTGVIPGFMIQGGGYTADMRQKPTGSPIRNEAANGLTNDRGTAAMARTSDPHSATSQFFINVADNNFLNHTDKSSQGWGYAVFGKVVEGMDVVDAIAGVPTGRRGPHADVPREPVIIRQVTVGE